LAKSLPFNSIKSPVRQVTGWVIETRYLRGLGSKPQVLD